MFWIAQSTIEETFRAYNDVCPPTRNLSRDEGAEAAAAIEAELKASRKMKEKTDVSTGAAAVGVRMAKAGTVSQTMQAQKHGGGLGTGKARRTGSTTSRVRMGHSFVVGTPTESSGTEKEMGKR